MYINKLAVHHFRNLHHIECHPSEKFNFIVGKNGSGKTSLLEAIHMIGHGRTFKHQQISRIIEQQQSELILFAELCHSNHNNYTVGVQKTRNKESIIKINHQHGFKQYDLAKLLPIQMITPESIDLLLGSPKLRRSYIDWGCFHQSTEFIHVWQNAARILKQRNAQLKFVNNYQQMNIWDEPLIELTEKIHQLRQHYLSSITPNIIQIAAEFLDDYQLTIDFYSGWDDKLPYAERLKEQFEKDRLLGYTQSGIHKADMRLKLNNVPVHDFASRGEMKLIMCALKLAQGIYYSEQAQDRCIFLIDDFAAELDSSKQKLFAHYLKKIDCQLFLTSLDITQIQDFIGENDKIYHMKHGII